jgi:SWI/SNF-related matrix-associated actin-dependent regulator 1 of chromatin subfamily A
LRTNSFDNEGNGSVGDRMLPHFLDEQQQEDGDEESAYKKLKQLFDPRRKKDDVLHQIIPPKEKVVEFVELDKRARDIYDSILEAHINKSATMTTAAIGDQLFTNLGKDAHHPLLLKTRHNTPEEIQHLTTYFHQYGAFKGECSNQT